MDLQTIIEKIKREWKEDPQKSENESEVISKYGNMFNPKNIDNLTTENFRSFLNIKNNKHWHSLERLGLAITDDLEKLKNTLRILLDETISIEDRIRRIRDKNSNEYHKWFGSAYYTPILLVVYPKKYPVINKIVKDVLEKTGIYPDYDSKPEWIAYSEVIPKIQQLAEKNHISLWQMDSVWFTYVNDTDSNLLLDKEPINNNMKTKELENRETDYFLVQVSDRGSENVLRNGYYTPHDKDLRLVKSGDILLVYFAKKSIDYKQQLKKIYRVTQVDNNIGIQLSEEYDLNGISIDKIRYAVESGKLRNVFNRIGLHGFNIIKIDKSDYDSIILLDRNLVNQKEFDVFLTAYPYENLQISKTKKILGWQKNSELSRGDHVFVYNKNSKNIECAFEIKSKSNLKGPIWEDEINSNSDKPKYKNRWESELICDNLNIGLEDIRQIVPFKNGNNKKDNNTKKANFGLLLLGGSPNSLTKPIYEPFRNYLLNKCSMNKIKNDRIQSTYNKIDNNLEVENKWLSLKVSDINNIIKNVLTTENKRLEIDENVVKRIISHLMVSKHVILVGPPGTGKTDLARRILRELGNKIIDDSEPIEAVASYEWGRYEVIGGRSITSNEEEGSFHFGCVTNAIYKRKFLLIDEFNRADMNKAFGEMFLALDHGEIQLREDEYIANIDSNKKILIPVNFRMICTMNDYDKSLLNELSYGLLRRFAFVEINVPDDKEKVKNIVLERTYEKLKYLNPNFNNKKVDLYVDKFIDFMFSLKPKREIGLASYIDVISYLIYSTTVMKNDPGSALNDSLIDYILPQFDRLDIETLRLAYENASKIFIFQDENGKTIESTGPFLFNLRKRIMRLEDLDKLFKFGEAI